MMCRKRTAKNAVEFVDRRPDPGGRENAGPADSEAVATLCFFLQPAQDVSGEEKNTKEAYNLDNCLAENGEKKIKHRG